MKDSRLFRNGWTKARSATANLKKRLAKWVSSIGPHERYWRIFDSYRSKNKPAPGKDRLAELHDLHEDFDKSVRKQLRFDKWCVIGLSLFAGWSAWLSLFNFLSGKFFLGGVDAVLVLMNLWSINMILSSALKVSRMKGEMDFMRDFYLPQSIRHKQRAKAKPDLHVVK